MTNITLKIEREDDLRQLLDLIRRLNVTVIQQTNRQAKTPSAKQRQKMIDYILTYQNNAPSFGDAAEWQRAERVERALPWTV